MMRCARFARAFGTRVLEALETQVGTVEVYLESAGLGFAPSERRDFHRALAAAPPGEIARAASAYFRWDRATVALVGDRKVIESQLAEASSFGALRMSPGRRSSCRRSRFVGARASVKKPASDHTLRSSGTRSGRATDESVWSRCAAPVHDGHDGDFPASSISRRNSTPASGTMGTVMRFPGGSSISCSHL